MIKIMKDENRECRSPHGERGLKSRYSTMGRWPNCRSPHGERGLKSLWATLPGQAQGSLPSRGAWIEIINLFLLFSNG